MDYKELQDQYNIANPSILNKFEVEKILETKFKASEIPLTSINEEDYLNDDEVDEKAIYKLYTIVDKGILSDIQTNQDREVYKDNILLRSTQFIDSILYQMKADGPASRVYNKLIYQHNKGVRVSIVLEKNSGDAISNFKVYGFASNLISYLHAILGVKGMIKRDINNQEFQYYLEALVENNLI